MLRRLALPVLVGVSLVCVAAVIWLAVLAAADVVGVHWPALVAIVSFGWIVETVRALLRKRATTEE